MRSKEWSNDLVIEAGQHDLDPHIIPRMSLANLFLAPADVDAVLIKVLTSNDDSGRHGVLVPKEGYGFFPEFPDFDPESKINYTFPIKTQWSAGDSLVERSSNWKHYHRYPERRMTALRSSKLDSAPPLSYIIVGRHGKTSHEYECHVLYPDDPFYSGILAEFGISGDGIQPGVFALVLDWKHTSPPVLSPALGKLLEKFDQIHGMGFVATRRAGDTGVGFTFETLMGITENNSRYGDFEGIEIKTYREKELRRFDAEKMNLFLLSPKWLDGKSNVQRLKDYGYVDDNGRVALYSAVQINENSHGFMFQVDDLTRRLLLLRKGVCAAFWEYDSLKSRLSEKHTDAVFISAKTRGSGANEQFHYKTLTHCSNPSVEAFLSLLQQGDVLMEIRMHLITQPKERVRDHGFGFRIKKNRIPMLYGSATLHRNYE